MAVTTDTEFQVGLGVNDKLTEPLNKVGQAADDSAKRVEKLSIEVIALNQATELAAKAWNFIKTQFDGSVGTFMKVAHAQHSLNTAMKIAGTFTKANVADFAAFSKELKATTTASGSAITSMLRQATALGVSHEQTKLMTKTATDLAVAMNTDVETAFNQLIAVNNGFVRGLGKSFPALKQFTDEQLRAGAGVEYLAKRLDGFAKAEAQTAHGQMIQLEKAIKGVKVAAGGLVVALFKGENAAGGSKFMQGVIDQVNKLAKVLKEDVLPIVLELHEELARMAAGVSAAFKGIDWEKVARGAAALGVALLAIAAPTLVAQLTTLAVTFVAWAAPLALAAAEATAMAAALIAIVVAVDLLVKNVEKIPDAFDLMAKRLLAIMETIGLNMFKAITFMPLKGIKLISDAAAKFLPGAAGRAAQAAKVQVDALIAGVDDKVKFAQQQIDKLWDKANEKSVKMFEGIDWGIAGDAFDVVTQAIEDFKKGLLDFKQVAEDEGDGLGGGDRGGGGPGAKMPELFSAEDLSLITEVFGGLTGGMAAAASSMMAVPLAIAQAANIILDAVAKIVQIIPELLNKFADILKMIEEFPLKLGEALTHVFDNIATLIPGFIENLFKLFDSILDIVATFPEKFLGGVLTMIQRLPDMLIRFIDRIPDVAERFVYGLVNKAPQIVAALTTSLIANLPKIMARITILAPKIGFAIVRGFLLGLRDALKEIFGGVKLPAVDDLKQGLKDVFSGDTSKLFNVSDLTETAPFQELQQLIDEAERIGKSIWQAFLDALRAGWDWLKKLGGKIWEGFKEAVGDLVAYFKEKGGAIWAGFKEAIGDVVAWFKETGKSIWNGFVDALRALPGFFKDLGMAIWTGLTEAIKDPIAKFKEWGNAIWKGLTEAVKDPAASFLAWGKKVWEGLTAAVKDPGATFTSWGTNIWNGLKDGVAGLGTLIKNQLDGINPANLFSKIFVMDYKGKGTVENTLGIDVPYANFAQGGMVPGVAAVSGDSLLNDRVLALLSPGEAVIPRSLMGDPGVKSIIDGVLSGALTPRRFAFGSNGDFNPFDDGGGISVGGSLGQVWDSLSGAAKNAFGPVARVVTDTLDATQITSLAKAIESGAINLGSSPAGAIAAAANSSLRDGATILQAAGGTISGVSKKALGAANKAIQDAGQLISWLDPSQLWTKVKEETFDAVIKTFEANRFHEGGVIGGAGEVPVLGEAGEFIINKRDTQRNLGALQAINAGGTVGGAGGGLVIEKLEINVRSDVEADMVSRVIWPEIERKLLRASQDGRRVLAPTGVR